MAGDHENEDVPFPGQRRCGNFKSKRTKDWHRNRQGNPCGKRLKVGQVACPFHGGKTKVAVAAEELRAATIGAHDRARRMVDARAGQGASLPEIMLDLLQSANALYRIYSEMVADLDHAGELATAAEPGRQRGFIERTYVPAEVKESANGHPAEILAPGYVKTEMDPLLVRAKDKIHVHPFVTQQAFWWQRTKEITKDCAVLRIEEARVQRAQNYADEIFAINEAQWKALNLSPEDRATAKDAMLKAMLRLELLKAAPAEQRKELE